ncbi:MAG TPA: hypothetical protein VFP32_01285 [Candidatus Saccharimonadales bacterium]|nr:hypothetical protein [Candidatus Saccharimonadales bacterium]
MKKILATLIAGVAMVLVPAGAAFAWSYGLTGTGECQPDGSFQISWKINNSSESKALVVTSSNRDVVKVGDSVPAYHSQTFTETVDGTKAGSFTLSLKANWPGGDTNQVSQSSTVHLWEACQQPPTLTVHKTTNPAGDQTSFMVTAATTDGAIYGGATQNIMDGGTVVYKVKAGGTYSVTEQTVNGWTMTSNSCQNLTVGKVHEDIVTYHHDEDSDQPVNVDCAIVNTKNVTPPTGGQGGGVVLGATTTTPQVQAPTGGVGAGFGGASSTTSVAALVGLVGSLGSIGYGIRRMSKHQL